MAKVPFPILVYHSIDDFRTSISISRTNFEKQMQWLDAHGWKTPGLDEALKALLGGRTLPPKSFAITFDDAMVTVRDIAQPVLQRHGFHATTFVITNLAGKKPKWYRLPKPYRDLPLLSFDDLKGLQDQGWDIQPHTHDHPVMPHLTYSLQLEQVRLSREILFDRLGVRGSVLAYPFGQFNAETIRAMQDAGYQAGLTLKFSTKQDTSQPYQFSRVGSAWIKSSSLRQRLVMGGVFEHYVHLKGRIRGDRSRHFRQATEDTTCGLLNVRTEPDAPGEA